MLANIIDLGFTVLLVVVLPLWGAHSFRKLRALEEAGESINRIRQYVIIMAMEWLLVVALVCVWSILGRDFQALVGVPHEDWRLWLGVGLTVACIAFFIWQVQAIAADKEAQQNVRESAAHLRLIAPATSGESRYFVALSLTAGICEEVLYRGFFIWYLEGVSNLWIAVVASSLVFGLGHAYQGFAGILKTAGIGLVFAGLYLLTGSLIVAMIVHAAVDIASGRILHIAFNPPSLGAIDGSGSGGELE